jgi:5'-nucleotidase
MKILLTNDDGPEGPGLVALAQALREFGNVTIVCPCEERSGVGHAITYLVPVHVGQARLDDGTRVRTLTGMPADCVKFGLIELLKSPPDMVASGINLGVNIGIDVFYSGTVAAAVEGGFNGVFSVAFSTVRTNAGRMAAAADQAKRVLRLLLDDGPPAGGVFNVNIPELSAREPEVRFTRQSRIFPPGSYLRMEGPRDRVHYWLDSTTGGSAPELDSDVAALEAGDISVTPLCPDLTDAAALERLRGHISARAGRA